MAEKAPGLFARISVNYEDDPGVLSVTPLAELLFLRSIVYAKRTNSDGSVPRKALSRLAMKIHGTDPAELAAELVEEGLWVDDDNGWSLPSFHRWQTTEGDQETIRAKRRQGGLARAHQRGDHAEQPHPDCERCGDRSQHVLSTSSAPSSAPAQHVLESHSASNPDHSDGEKSSMCSAPSSAHAEHSAQHTAQDQLSTELSTCSASREEKRREEERSTSPLVTKEGRTDDVAQGAGAAIPPDVPQPAQDLTAKLAANLGPYRGGFASANVAQLAYDIRDAMKAGHHPANIYTVAMKATKAERNRLGYASTLVRDMIGDEPVPWHPEFSGELDIPGLDQRAAPPANIRDGLTRREPLRAVDDTS